jgi:AcrR family transcriptional regulator
MCQSLTIREVRHVPRSREDVRRRLQLAALALYQERGYDRTTAAEIAARAGVTERTFFRHFADKREVLFDGETRLHDALSAAIAEAPKGLGPMQVLLWAFRSTQPMFEENRPLTEPGREVIARTPALQERQLAKAASTIAVVAAALQRRGVAPDLADLAAGAGMMAFGHAVRAWFDDPSLSLSDHLERAIEALRGLSASRAVPTAR